jgi:hypothetical protein
MPFPERDNWFTFQIGGVYKGERFTAKIRTNGGPLQLSTPVIRYEARVCRGRVSSHRFPMVQPTMTQMVTWPMGITYILQHERAHGGIKTSSFFIMDADTVTG